MIQKEHLTPELEALSERWPIVRVDEVFSIQQGKQVSKKNRKGDNQRPFLRTRNVLWGRLDLADLDLMHFTADDEARLALASGDLLMCEGGWVGRTAIWREEVSQCYYQNHLHRLRRVDDRVLPDFALHWFWYAFEYGQIYFGRKNVTTIPNMSKSRLAELPFPLPDPEEQERIAALLSAALRLVEQREYQAQLAVELKNALTQRILSGQTSVTDSALADSGIERYLSRPEED